MVRCPQAAPWLQGVPNIGRLTYFASVEGEVAPPPLKPTRFFSFRRTGLGCCLAYPCCTENAPIWVNAHNSSTLPCFLLLITGAMLTRRGLVVQLDADAQKRAWVIPATVFPPKAGGLLWSAGGSVNGAEHSERSGELAVDASSIASSSVTISTAG
jgi:hypothetical protein